MKPSLRSRIMNATWTYEGGKRLHTSLTVEQLDKIMELVNAEIAEAVDMVSKPKLEEGEYISS